jgi:3-phosphoshikimate 1-carboxyvinyltransferase
VSGSPRRFIVHPGGRLTGRITVPGDKSISHRAIMLGALAEGVTRVSGFLEGADTLATLAAFQSLGVPVIHHGAGSVTIHGVGLDGLSAPDRPLDLGNSGTSMRLLCGLLAGQSFDSVLTGDASLVRRPMRRVTEPLARMGARIDTTAEGTAPLHIHAATAPLQGISYAMPVASAQVKSCLLLAGLRAEGSTRIEEPGPSRDHSEVMLAGFGWPLRRGPGWVELEGRAGRLEGCDVAVPADISSAAFFLVGAAIAEGSDLTLCSVGINPTRTGVIDILRAMGADITIGELRHAGGEPVADLHVRHAGRLRGIDIDPALVPLAIDEFPSLFIAAAAAEGVTTLRGAEELRVKESDRIQSMADGLRACGVQAEALPDGIRITGGGLRAGVVDSRGDHRIAMSFAMAGLVAGGPITIDDCVNVDTSFPGFAALASSAGLALEVVEGEGS